MAADIVKLEYIDEISKGGSLDGWQGSLRNLPE
jgi:hypothetical protein